MVAVLHSMRNPLCMIQLCAAGKLSLRLSKALRLLTELTVLSEHDYYWNTLYSFTSGFGAIACLLSRYDKDLWVSFAANLLVKDPLTHWKFHKLMAFKTNTVGELHDWDNFKLELRLGVSKL